MSDINNISPNESYEQEFSDLNTNTTSARAIPIKHDHTTSLSSLSSILTDQLPSSFGSMTTIDQFFINPKKTSSNSSLNWLGMTGGSSIYSPDPVIQDANLKEKAKKGIRLFHTMNVAMF